MHGNWYSLGHTILSLTISYVGYKGIILMLTSPVKDFYSWLFSKIDLICNFCICLGDISKRSISYRHNISENMLHKVSLERKTVFDKRAVILIFRLFRLVVVVVSAFVFYFLITLALYVLCRSWYLSPGWTKFLNDWVLCVPMIVVKGDLNGFGLHWRNGVDRRGLCLRRKDHP